MCVIDSEYIINKNYYEEIMGNVVDAKFKGTPDTDSKIEMVFGGETEFAAFTAVLDNDKAAKSQFEAILADNTNGMPIESFWESDEPNEWMKLHLQSDQRA